MNSIELLKYLHRGPGTSFNFHAENSVANLWINGVNWGLFWMAEDINEDFLAVKNF